MRTVRYDVLSEFLDYVPISRSLSQAHESVAVVRRVRWQSKALSEYFFQDFFSKVTGQVKVRAKVKIVTFALSVTEMEVITAASPNHAEIPLKGWIRYHMSMDPLFSKGQCQGQVKYGHQVKMLHRYSVTNVFTVVWDVIFDGDIHFLNFT